MLIPATGANTTTGTSRRRTVATESPVRGTHASSSTIATDALTGSSVANSGTDSTRAMRIFVTGLTPSSHAAVRPATDTAALMRPPRSSMRCCPRWRTTSASCVTATTVPSTCDLPLQQRDELAPAAAVLTEGRLVEHDHRGRGCQDRRDRQPPLLSARERERVGFGEGGQVEPLEQFVDDRVDLGRRHPEGPRTDGEFPAQRRGEETGARVPGTRCRCA